MPAVLRPYRELLATPGGQAFSGAAFVARMPISMMGLGIVLLVVSEQGRYGLAGAVSAMFAIVNAGSPRRRSRDSSTGSANAGCSCRR